jgi:hypothetical protein
MGLAGGMPMSAMGAFFPLFLPSFFEFFFRFAKREPADANRSTFGRRGRPIAQKQVKAKGGKRSKGARLKTIQAEETVSK